MKKQLAIFGVAFLITIVTTILATAQETQVYIDKSEKEFYTAKQAEMMGYKNENGKKLKKVSAAPAAYKPTDDLTKMYVDEAEKEYYTPVQAKKMRYKNESGTPLTQMSEIPTDFGPTDDLNKKN